MSRLSRWALWPMALLPVWVAGTAVAQTQLEMNERAAASAKAADGRLNAAYAKLRVQPELKQAQRAWVAFRDSECRYEASVYSGGSIQPMTYSLCIERVTRARTAELLELSKFEEYRR